MTRYPGRGPEYCKVSSLRTLDLMTTGVICETKVN